MLLRWDLDLAIPMRAARILNIFQQVKNVTPSEVVFPPASLAEQPSRFPDGSVRPLAVGGAGYTRDRCFMSVKQLSIVILDVGYQM